MQKLSLKSYGLSFPSSSKIWQNWKKPPSAADKNASSLLVVAHNPGVHGFVMGLVSDVKDGVPTDPLMHGYPPGTLSVFTFDTDDWQDVAPHTGHLVCCKAPD